VTTATPYTVSQAEAVPSTAGLRCRRRSGRGRMPT
jgi:hypothetical protein